MKVHELIKALQKANPDAEVEFVQYGAALRFSTVVEAGIELPLRVFLGETEHLELCFSEYYPLFNTLFGDS